MSGPLSDLTPLGTNTTNRKISPSDLIPVETKFPKPTPQTLPTDPPALTTDLPEENEKANEPGDPDSEPTLSYSSKKSNSSNDTNLSKSNRKQRNKKKKRQK